MCYNSTCRIAETDSTEFGRSNEYFYTFRYFKRRFLLTFPRVRAYILLNYNISCPVPTFCEIHQHANGRHSDFPYILLLLVVVLIVVWKKRQD